MDHTLHSHQHPLDSTLSTVVCTQLPTMELAEVKARVKAWEKAFRAQQGREPTKDDIKRDDSDIGEWNALRHL